MKSKVPVVKIFKISELTKADTNVRDEYNEDVMAALQTSIEYSGLLELPKCTSSGKVFAGWSRIEACKAIGFEDVPCIVIDYMSDDDQIVASLAENTARGVLQDYEKRWAVKKLRDSGKDGIQIAKLTGMNEATVYTLLSFYRLPEKTQDVVLKKAEEGENIPFYTMAKVSEIVEKVTPKGTATEEERTAVGNTLVEIATTRSPSGKKITRPFVQQIAEKADLGKAGLTELQKILKQAQKKEYMTITLAIPDDYYLPFFKYAKGKSLTIHEAIVEAMESYMPIVDKFLKSK